MKKELTERELKQYSKLKKEIKDLQRRIKKEQEKESLIVAGKVKGSSKYFPYIERNFPVEIYEPIEYDRSCKLIRIMEEKQKELQELVEQIESFVESIEDSELRLIFRYRFLDNLTQEEISKKVCLDRSRVSRKISDYLKNAHKAQIKVL